MKIICIFGTRPEAIKLLPIINRLKNDPFFRVVVCSTGQHKEMLQDVLDVFNIIPDYNLDLMKEGQTLIQLSNSILHHVDLVLKKEKPDLVLVHGDTSTTLNAALAAFYNKIPIGHVEAGLRTHNRYSPFPEEMNRRLMASLATIHFAPTEKNKLNLLKENVNEQQIYVTGNTVIDSLIQGVKNEYVFHHKKLNTIHFNKKIVLLTTHRRENWGSNMVEIFNSVKELAKEKDVEIIFPMHKNPQIRELATDCLSHIHNVHLIDTLNYLDFVNLMSRVYLIMTDSGGIQEEGPSLNKPVVVLRDTTERQEAIEANTVKLAGVKKESIVNCVRSLLNSSVEYQKMVDAKNPYGDGLASLRIINALKSSIIN